MDYEAGTTKPRSGNDNRTVLVQCDKVAGDEIIRADYNDIESVTASTDNHHTNEPLAKETPDQRLTIIDKRIMKASLSVKDGTRKEKRKRRGLFVSLAVIILLLVTTGVVLLVLWRLGKIDLSEACNGSDVCKPNYSECGNSGLCRCSEGYYDTNGPTSGGTCARKVALTEPCSQPDACRDENAVCGTDNICVCSEYFYHSIHLTKGSSCKPIPCIESSATYDGNVSVTISGRRCQAWDSHVPHQHNVPFGTFPENYCRGTFNKDLPLCFTEDPGMMWEFCPVYTCQGSCLSKYTEYKGRINFTLSGRPCLNWDQIDVDQHKDWTKNLSEDHNFCRDPSDKGRPWCFVNVELYNSSRDPEWESHEEWEFCPVPICSGNKDQPAVPYSDVQYVRDTSDMDAGVCYEKSTSYNGTRSKTTTGYTCQNWNTFTPRFHNVRDASLFPENSLDEARNYCRDPEGKGFTYCYIADDARYLYEGCAITECTPVPELCPDEDEKPPEMENGPNINNKTEAPNDVDVGECIPRTNLALNFTEVWAHSEAPFAPPDLAVDGSNQTYAIMQKSWWLELPRRTPIKKVDILIAVIDGDGGNGDATLCVTVDEVPCECFPSFIGYGRKIVLCEPTLIGTFIHITQEPSQAFVFLTEVEIYSVL